MSSKIQAWKINRGSHAAPQAFPLPDETSTLDGATRIIPQGGYTTFRTFSHNRVLLMNDHFTRLQETARLAGHPLVVDPEQLRSALRLIFSGFTGQEKRVRMVLDLEIEPGTMYIMVEDLTTPSPNDYRMGVKAITLRMHRENPKAKLTSFIQQAAHVRHVIPAGLNEALMIGEDGRVLEGLSSNIFGVRGGEVWTADEGVLNGITRALTLEVIHALGYPLRLAALDAEELPTLDEAFITSASRAVLPLTEIDGQPVGNGLPGPLTLAILKGYSERLEIELQAI